MVILSSALLFSVLEQLVERLSLAANCRSLTATMRRCCFELEVRITLEVG